MSGKPFIPLREMEHCAIFQNKEFLKELQKSVLTDMLARNRLSEDDYQLSIRHLDQGGNPPPGKKGPN